MRLIVPLLLATAAACTVAAETATPGEVGSDVTSVVSQAWRDGEGRVRVIVRTQGFEHVSSSATAQWMRIGETAPGALRATASKALVVAGSMRLDPPRLVADGDAIRVELGGVRTYQPDIAIRCVFVLLPDGGMRTVQPCE